MHKKEKGHLMDYHEFFYPFWALLRLEYTDFIEIGFFSTIIYYLCLWLKKDTQKNLLGMFLTYYSIIILSFMTNLQTIFIFLIYLSPLIGMLFIIFHQESMQRNFLTFFTVKPPQKNTSTDWLEILFRTLMQAFTIDKELTIIIERTQSLANYIATPSFLNLDLRSDALLMLIHSDLFDDSKLCWINDKGVLVAINATYNIENNSIPLQNVKLSTTDQRALLYCSKTDALIIQMHKKNKLCSLWVNNNVVHDLTLPQGLQITKKYIQVTDNTGDSHNAWIDKKNNNLQPQS